MGSKQEDWWVEESCWNRHGDTGSKSLHLEKPLQVFKHLIWWTFLACILSADVLLNDTRHTHNVGNLSPWEICGWQSVFRSSWIHVLFHEEVLCSSGGSMCCCHTANIFFFSGLEQKRWHEKLFRIELGMSAVMAWPIPPFMKKLEPSVQMVRLKEHLSAFLRGLAVVVRFVSLSPAEPQLFCRPSVDFRYTTVLPEVPSYLPTHALPRRWFPR